MGNFHHGSDMNIKEEGLIKSQLFAKSLAGELLTKEYINSMNKMLWKCDVIEHEPFLKSLDKVKINQWCDQCKKDGKKINFSEKIALDNWNKENLEKIKKFLTKHNATLLSKEYKSLVSTLDINCNICNCVNNETALTILNNKYKCNHCSNYQNLGLLKAKALAEKMNGVLISEKYDGNKEKLKWKCHNPNHAVFDKSFNHVCRGIWCNSCKNEKLTIKKEKTVLINKKRYEKRELLEKKTISLNEKRKERYDKILSILKEKNLKTFNTEYVNQYQKIDLQCNICFHNWSNNALTVFKGEIACQKCFPKTYEYDYKNSKRRSSKELKVEIEKIVKNKNGKVIEYLPGGEGIFSCMISEHSQWKARVKNIVNGAWCRDCANETYREKNKNKIKSLAENRKGECLNSNVYANNKTLLTWKCDNEEHSPWQANYHSINTLGSWCPECATNNKSEERTREMLEYLLGYKFEKSYPEWLVNDLTERQMELDGFNIENKIAFEFQGEQHYKLCGWNNESSLKELQYRDDLKKKLCKDNNVVLLIIDESSKTKRWNGLLDEILNSLIRNNVYYRKDIDEQKVKKIFYKY